MEPAMRALILSEAGSEDSRRLRRVHRIALYEEMKVERNRANEKVSLLYE